MKFSVQTKHALVGLFTELAKLIAQKEILIKICLLLQVYYVCLHTD